MENGAAFSTRLPPLRAVTPFSTSLPIANAAPAASRRSRSMPRFGEKHLAVVFLPYRYCLLLMIDAQTSPPMIFTFGPFDFC
ncbi:MULTISPECIES: hypothetical protein [Stutzerimonas stutzeri group]|uniref:hypothetical protein n=1 Tax=Stutzerimonas stutzeri group TaxID=136846 RepID=UPI0011B034B3|nr:MULTISPECIES: hypothetical protein [Stutzerimonas stutzeri group]